MGLGAALPLWRCSPAEPSTADFAFGLGQVDQDQAQSDRFVALGDGRQLVDGSPYQLLAGLVGQRADPTGVRCGRVNRLHGIAGLRDGVGRQKPQRWARLGADGLSGQVLGAVKERPRTG